MSKTVLTNVKVTINAIDLSDHVQKVEVKQSKDKVDVTSMGAAAKQYLPGLGDNTVSITFFNDFAASSVNATLQPLFVSGSQFPVVVIPVNGAITATNPSFTGTFALYDYTPLSGGVGDASMMDVEFTNANQAGIVMGTA